MSISAGPQTHAARCAEIGHNVLHGQWDWMRDTKIHSTTWEWDTALPADQWKHSHNFVHHTWTNVLGKDRDIGYSLLWGQPGATLASGLPPPADLQPSARVVLRVRHRDLRPELERLPAGEKSPEEAWTQLRAVAGKIRRQIIKDYLAFPLLAGPGFLPVLLGNLTANLTRNVWAHTIIFCGHFTEGAQVFTEDQLEGETRGEWYVRQLLGSCNIDGGRLLHLMSGNLSHQIEHHLFPDLPSNRYAQIALRIRALCQRFELPYNSGSLARQTSLVHKRILRLALPGPRHRQPAPPTPDLHAVV